MSRLKYEDVANAAMLLINSGVEPTSKKLLLHLGRGSYTTIIKHRNEWMKSDEAVNAFHDLRSVHDRIPEALEVAFKNFLGTAWKQAIARAESQVLSDKEHLDEIAEEWTHKFDVLEHNYDELNDKYRNKCSELDAISAKLKSTELELAGINAQFKKEMKGIISSHEIVISSLDNQIKSLTADNKSKVSDLITSKDEVMELKIELATRKVSQQ